MVPAFVNMNKDNDGFIHLYFFPGVDDEDKPIYRDMDLSNIPFTYTCIKGEDSSLDYKFDNKSICKIHCKLVPNGNGEIKFKTLEIKND